VNRVRHFPGDLGRAQNWPDVSQIINKMVNVLSAINMSQVTGLRWCSLVSYYNFTLKLNSNTKLCK